MPSNLGSFLAPLLAPRGAQGGPTPRAAPLQVSGFLQLLEKIAGRSARGAGGIEGERLPGVDPGGSRPPFLLAGSRPAPSRDPVASSPFTWPADLAHDAIGPEPAPQQPREAMAETLPSAGTESSHVEIDKTDRPVIPAEPAPGLIAEMPGPVPGDPPDVELTPAPSVPSEAPSIDLPSETAPVASAPGVETAVTPARTEPLVAGGDRPRGPTRSFQLLTRVAAILRRTGPVAPRLAGIVQASPTATPIVTARQPATATPLPGSTIVSSGPEVALPDTASVSQPVPEIGGKLVGVVPTPAIGGEPLKAAPAPEIGGGPVKAAPLPEIGGGRSEATPSQENEGRPVETTRSPAPARLAVAPAELEGRGVRRVAPETPQATTETGKPLHEPAPSDPAQPVSRIVRAMPQEATTRLESPSAPKLPDPVLPAPDDPTQSDLMRPFDRLRQERAAGSDFPRTAQGDGLKSAIAQSLRKIRSDLAESAKVRHDVPARRPGAKRVFRSRTQRVASRAKAVADQVDPTTVRDALKTAHLARRAATPRIAMDLPLPPLQEGPAEVRPAASDSTGRGFDAFRESLATEPQSPPAGSQTVRAASARETAARSAARVSAVAEPAQGPVESANSNSAPLERPSIASSFPVQRHEALAQAILARAKSLPQNGSVEVRFALAPPELGAVRIRIQARGDRLLVEMLASSHSAADTLTAGLPRLTSQLHQAGYPQAEVTLDLETQTHAGTQSGQQPGETSRQASGADPALRQSTDDGTDPETSEPGRTGRLDRMA